MSRRHLSAAGDGFYIRNLHALNDVTLSDLKHEARAWSERHASGHSNNAFVPRNPDQQVLKVGFLSRRFCRHAVGFFTVGALENLDRTKIEPVLFVTRNSNDDYWDRFTKTANAVHDISALNDDEVAGLIRHHGIHILIDMAGHSADGRIGVMVRKPAPVQAKWVGGQHGTMGLEAIDFFITDPIETPAEDDIHFVERAHTAARKLRRLYTTTRCAIGQRLAWCGSKFDYVRIFQQHRQNQR